MSVPDRAFFEVTAQVVPVLMLALLLDHPVEPDPLPDDAPRHRLATPERRVAFDRLLMLAGLVWAEIAALVAVAGRPTRFELSVVLFGLALGAFGIIDRVVNREIDRLNRTMRRRSRLVMIVVLLLAVLTPIVAGFALALY